MVKSEQRGPAKPYKHGGGKGWDGVSQDEQKMRRMKGRVTEWAAGRYSERGIKEIVWCRENASTLSHTVFLLFWRYIKTKWSVLLVLLNTLGGSSMMSQNSLSLTSSFIHTNTEGPKWTFCPNCQWWVTWAHFLATFFHTGHETALYDKLLAVSI